MPVWTPDLVTSMRQADCDYVSDCQPAFFQDSFCLTGRQRDLIASAPTPDIAILLRDMFLPRPFAEALFIAKGAEDEEAAARNMGWVRLVVSGDRVNYTHKTPAGWLDYDNDVAREIVAKLDEGPQALSELAATIDIDDDIFFSILDGLCASGQVWPCDGPVSATAVERLNAVVKARGLDVAMRADVHGTPFPIGSQ